MPLQDFDARAVQPQQAMDKHPVGMFDFNITNTFLKHAQDEQSLLLMVEFASPAGSIIRNYMVDGAPGKEKAIEIFNSAGTIAGIKMRYLNFEWLGSS